MGLAVYIAETTHDPAYFPSASCTTLFPPRPQSPICVEKPKENKSLFFQLKSIVIETARATTGHLLCLLYQKHPLGQSQQTLRACVGARPPTHYIDYLEEQMDVEATSWFFGSWLLSAAKIEKKRRCRL